MTKQVQIRRGTDSQHTSFTGAEGEISVNTTNDSVHVHDGTTAGGKEMARADGSNVAFTSGTIDGTVIGGTTPAAGTFTTGDFNTSLNVDGTITSDGLTVDGDAVISSSNARLRLKETDTTDNDTQLQTTGGVFKISRLDDDNSTATQRFTIDNSTGNTKIGTGTDRFSFLTASSSNLQLDGGIIFEAGSGNNAEIFNYRSTDMLFGNSGASQMVLDGSGNLGIGTSSITSGFKMEVTGDARFGDAYNDDAVELGWSAGGSVGFVQAYDRGASAFRDLQLNNAVMIDTSGNLLVGKTSQTIDTVGAELLGSIGKVHATRDGGAPAGFNRKTSDGSIVEFYKDGSTVGSIGTNASQLYVASGDTGLQYNGTADQIRPCDGSGAARDNAIDLGDTTRRFKNFHLNGGIYFGSRSNALDDYEEGTWTPVLSGAGGSGTYQAAEASGSYVKIGRVVHVIGLVSLASSITGGGSSYAMISGLPYNYDQSFARGLSGAVKLSNVAYNSGSYVQAGREAGSDSDTIAFYESKPSTGLDAVQISEFSASDQISFNLTYFTT